MHLGAQINSLENRVFILGRLYGLNYTHLYRYKYCYNYYLYYYDA